MTELIIAALIGYLSGAIPFGLVLTRLAGLGDIRAIGSGNIGATNVLRTGNKGLAAATLLFDVLKGTVPVLIAPLAVAALGFGVTAVSASVTAEPQAVSPMVAAAYGAFIGHCYPVWLGFRGGKGVATYIGVLLGLFWPTAAIFCATWLLIAVILRYSSLSALVASLVAPAATAILGQPHLAVVMLPLSLLLIFRHRTNIGRLLSGTEPRIGHKA